MYYNRFRRLLFSLIALAVCLSVDAAAPILSSNNKAALKFYQMARMAMSRFERIDYLEKAINKDKTFTEAYWDLAEIYSRNRGLDEAMATLRLADTPKTPRRAETQCRIAEIYYLQRKYDEAIATLEVIEAPEVAAVKAAAMQTYQAAKRQLEAPVPFEPKNLTAVNTDLDDYFPSITADERIISTTVSDRSGWGSSQEDLYWSMKVGGEWMPSVPMRELNTLGNEGSQSFSADGRYMFFVACNRSDGLGGCDIYYSIRIGNGWSRPLNAGAPLNSPMWETNPVLSPAGNELFFVTNREPNLGEKDIWSCRVKILDDGFLEFSSPRNLGRQINTAYNDFAPFIHADNRTLYFASDGRGGMGGADIFYAERGDSGWSEPKNIGYPINSESDEYGFVVNAAGDKAYISANRKALNSRGLDIFEFELYEAARPNPMSFRVGRVVDATTRKPLNAYVEVYDAQSSTTIFESQSDRKTGDFTLYMPAKGDHALNVRRKNYLFYSDNISAGSDSLLVELIPIGKGRTLILNNLFFAFNSAEIEPASDKELSRLVAFLNSAPTMQVEIVGHTDNVGTEAYNLDLSARRAAAVRDALIARGIAAERLTSAGRGSSQPIDTNDTDAGRQRNRRVECTVK